MKKSIFGVLFMALAVIACKENKNEEAAMSEEEVVVEKEATDTDMAFASFGEKINDTEVLTSEEMFKKFQGMKPGDTVDVKFKAKVNSVCQKKGCWMRLKVGENDEAFVKFKDYGFFMPKDIADQEAIVAGKAYVEETSVEDLKHFAQDAGKSEEEIAAITETDLTYTVISHGVLLPEMEMEQ